MSDSGQRLHAIAVELAAMAQNGLNYATDRYDLTRYQRLQGAAADILGVLGDCDADPLRSALAAERGHATPKVDVRGALFDQAGQVLLVRERSDGGWTLPGGWAEALDSPAVAVQREFAEEAGLAVRATRLVAVHDGSRRNGHGATPWHIYKLFFDVRRADDADDADPVAGLDGETTDVGFFALDRLPALSTRRCTAEQLRLLGAHHADPRLPTSFD